MKIQNKKKSTYKWMKLETKKKSCWKWMKIKIKKVYFIMNEYWRWIKILVSKNPEGFSIGKQINGKGENRLKDTSAPIFEAFLNLPSIVTLVVAERVPAIFSTLHV